MEESYVSEIAESIAISMPAAKTVPVIKLPYDPFALDQSPAISYSPAPGLPFAFGLSFLQIAKHDSNFVHEVFGFQSQIKIGRKEDCDLVLNASNVSRQHAQISVELDQLWLKDLGSATGTFIRVERELLAVGMKYELGDKLLVVERLKPLLEFSVGQERCQVIGNNYVVGSAKCCDYRAACESSMICQIASTSMGCEIRSLDKVRGLWRKLQPKVQVKVGEGDCFKIYPFKFEVNRYTLRKLPRLNYTQLLCAVCSRGRVGVGVACGHLAVCGDCVSNTKTCPKCKKQLLLTCNIVT